MALSENINSLEKDKFRESNNKSSVAVSIESGILSGITYDKIAISYLTGTTELYTYTHLTVEVAKILITYTNSTKEDLLTVERV